MIAAAELASVWLGLRLDLYELLRGDGPATVAELAERAGIDIRYAREWLEQQAVAGFLDADHPAHAGAAAYWVGSLAEVLQRIPRLYRSGAGLPYPEYGADVRLAIANFDRLMFVNDLAGWFAATPSSRPAWPPTVPGCWTPAAGSAGPASRWPGRSRPCGWTGSTCASASRKSSSSSARRAPASRR